MKVRIFRVIPPGLFMVLCIATSCGESKESRMQTFLERGNASLAQSDGEQAIYYYQQAIRLDSCYADAWNNIGTVHFNNHRMDEALHHYNKAVGCDPEFLDAYFNRFNTQLQLHNFDAALTDIGHVLAVKPDTAVALFSRGLVYSELGRFDEALLSFELAAARDTALRVDALVNMATVKIRMKKFAEAESELKILLQSRPGEANIYNSLALIAVETGNPDEALGQVTKALTILPDQPYFLNNRGYIFLMRNELDRAVADIDRSLTIDPYNGWAYRNKGVFYFLKGDLVQAARLLEQALAINENIDLVNYYLGMVYLDQGKTSEGCAHVRVSRDGGEDLPVEKYTRQCRAVK